ncbi:MAG: gamma-glutamyltransferase [Rhodobacteraceae bacterium]|nr:gamma-glutamyltransferase [Paracoccaceae bacterium]
MNRLKLLFLTILTLITSGPLAAGDQANRAKALIAKQQGIAVEAQRWMISAANPLAVEAGAQVLAKGGSAADAMVAAQAVLGLVEPQSSGLGGGAFLVWYDAASGQMTTLDGRETAPLAATPRLFQDDNGKPLSFFEAVVGGRSVGVPATPLLMQEAHARWGNASWPELLEPARKLAQDGFVVSERLARSIKLDAERLAIAPDTAAYFLPDGQPLQAGEILKNPGYAETLENMAKNGAAVFYSGPLAKKIVARVQSAANPGVLELVDLAIYRIKERPAVCVDYHANQVCGMGPPSSGALTVGQILKLVEPYDLAALGKDSAQSWRLIGDATRLAFADRGRYMADMDFVPVPVRGLLDAGYLATRSGLLGTDKALGKVAAGQPEYDHGVLLGEDISIEFPSTSHISIVDSHGNALSMTTTVENIFGSRLMVGGFLLNNELTDFSFTSHNNGWPIANRVEPGKRPRSSMSPTIVLRDGKPVLVIGSPGGSRIIGFVAQTLIAHLDWGMDIQQAISMPRLVNRFGTYEVEDSAFGTVMAPQLEALGFKVKQKAITSGLHGISIGKGLKGGADPRREGIVLGQ